MVTVKATYTINTIPGESLDMAERRAINAAKAEALRQEFGNVISGASATAMIEKNGITKSSFVTLSSAGELNGEWIADLEPPKIVKQLTDDGMAITCTVRGKAQRIKSGSIDFKASLLRGKDRVENAMESDEYYAGDMIFVRFVSPVEGYLAVYLLDGQTAACVLPYGGSSTGYFHVEANREYTLFSRKKYSPEENPGIIDEYYLTCDGEFGDLNQFYFIFSPNKFVKPVDRERLRDNDDDRQYPRFLPWDNFQKWLIKTRKRDSDMTVQQKNIVVKPKRD
jgi:hypothetical protein